MREHRGVRVLSESRPVTIASARAARLAMAGLVASLPLVIAVGPSDRGSALAVAPPKPSSPAPPVAVVRGNPGYTGQFIFTRIRYGGGGRRRGGDSWAHDYPQADLNMPQILSDISTVDAYTGGSNVLDLEDPEIFRHPILYLSEPGFWGVSFEGAENLRQHLLKGGFIIFDDFEAEQWYNFAAQMKRVLPEHTPIEIDASHPIFDSFFRVLNPYVPHPLVRVTPAFYGYFEDDDPTKRMLAMVNFNSDLAEYWEYSGRGFFAVDLTNEAWKLGVNYIVWGFSH
jgi:hypothetical protein